MNGNHCTHEDMSNFEGGRKVISIILMIDLMIKTFIFTSKTAVNKYSKVGQWSYPETLLTISLFNVSKFIFVATVLGVFIKFYSMDCSFFCVNFECLNVAFKSG